MGQGRGRGSERGSGTSRGGGRGPGRIGGPLAAGPEGNCEGPGYSVQLLQEQGEMWIVRFVLLGLLATYVCISGYFLKYRDRYKRLLENGFANLVLVVLYNLLCYLIVGLPSDQSALSPPAFLIHTPSKTGLSILGQVLIVAGVTLLLIAVTRRKALGGQEVKEGLLTSGIYRYFRHPIYTGIVWIALGFPLTTQNLDGLLMFPGVFLANIAQATVEERWDVGVRFQAEYEEYRKTTRMFGPVWFWVALIGILLALVGVPYLLRP
jgi:protein-S-isoprenylcysteine O-methyltransferase Ste14